MNHTTTRARRLGAVLATAAVLFAPACGSDDDETTTATTEAPATSAPTPDAPAEPADDDHTLHVTAVDFAFEDLPSEIPAGTRITLGNDAPSEMHELVAIRLPDEETRSATELMALPEAELGALMGGAEPATVLLAEPGGEQIPAVGDGTLTEPGRYLILCAIPTGVDPAVYLQAAAESAGGPPEVEGGPPHFVNGMFAEVTVVEA
ncbi:MAG TPA: hypothetical protein PKE56_13195 [Acidimicrobiales bacterium]|nr:hypothetical protein [Acidimicrobiales bacterium]